ncbi:hypothetical protein LOD99_12657 [Oopsacas minuta]|uniref:Raptor N-terminal CASPase-like domain-containing protein n=1 Tax=Oopsacas minuta TaxID=111878 RepID=A0AAV7JCX8_9METZ|nr:hypothetical protein LOD99_12657 [Oopsacas minuta]
MALDLEKCEVKKIDEANEKDLSSCSVNFENCLFFLIIVCLFILICLQLFSQTYKIQLVTDSSIVLIIDNENSIATPIKVVPDEFNNELLEQDIQVYSLKSQKHSIEARVMNSSKDPNAMKVNLMIERANTIPIIDWLKNCPERMTQDQLNSCPSPTNESSSLSTHSPVLSPLPLFSEPRHKQDNIEDEPIKGKWRVKDRMKTFSVALILCLNPGVDPPDSIRPKNSARMECWIDPMTGAKAVEAIGQALQRQYERWQPRARIKVSIEPTTEEVKKLCVSLRNQAQDDRVLFHYNGHGVPKPTQNGEIWIFNKDYTQYIPLSIYDLIIWIGAPSVFVWDCALAGLVVKWYNTFAEQRQKDQAKYGVTQVPDYKANSIHLAACSEDELLPIHPLMPSDLFSATLTTPIKVSILSFSYQNRDLIPWADNITLERIDALPGKIADRRSLVGELNWVFTAITDTIAWTTLPRDLFLRLFRQDLLVASLFRNFLLADRLMRYYGCVPVSHPPLPPTYKHHLWLSWDNTLNSLLKEMDIYKDTPYPNPLHRSHSTEFFTEQIKCFSRCLNACSYSPDINSPPEQLPILLQVLLSKADRLSALNLLCTYMDEGPQAVHLVLSVGIFPYVLKLLHSSFVELKRLMIYIWAKILAVEPDCKVDLVREKSFEYFVNAVKDTSLEPEYRSMSCFVLSRICDDYPLGNEACFNIELGFVCLSQLEMCPNSQPFLLQWLCLCLSRFWQGSEQAISSAHRSSAHEILYPLMNNQSPEVRACAISALSALTSQSQVPSQKSDTISHDIMSLLINMGTRDASPIVRREMVTIMQAFINQFDQQFFNTIARTHVDHTRNSEPYSNEHILTSTLFDEWVAVIDTNKNIPLSESGPNHVDFNSNGDILMSCSSHSSHRRRSSMDVKVPSSLLRNPTLSSPNNIYLQIWDNLMLMREDSCESVSNLTKHLCAFVFPKVHTMVKNLCYDSEEEQDPQFTLSPEVSFMSVHSANDTPDQPPAPTVGLYPWSARYFTKPILRARPELDIDPFLKIYYSKRKNETLANHTDFCVYSPRQLQEAIDNTVAVSCDYVVENSVTMKFHPFECNLALATDKLVKIYNFSSPDHEETADPLLPSISFNAVSSINSRLSAIEYLNPIHYPLLLVLEDNGNIRIWKDIEVFPNSTNPEDQSIPSIVSGWRAIPSLAYRTNCKLTSLKYHETAGLLFVAANEPLIHIWDLHSEMLRQTISLPFKDNVSSLALHPTNNDLFLAGDCEGYVLLFDMRERRNLSTWSMRVHSHSILSINMMSKSQDRFCTFSVEDEIQISDIRTHDFIKRFSTGLKTLDSVAKYPSTDLTAVSGSGSSDVLLFSDYSSPLQMCNLKNKTPSGKVLRNRINLLFHPLKLWLTASFEQETKIYSLMDGFTLHKAHVLH